MTEIDFQSQGEQNIDGFLKRAFDSRSFRVFQLAGDASARRYFRIENDGKTYVLMVWEPFVDDGNYPFLNILNHWQSLGINVPKVMQYDSSLGLVLLEDLGDLTLERKFWENQSEEASLPFYKKTLEALSRVHYPKDPKNYVARNIEFNIEKFMWEFNYAYKHFFKSMCEISLSDSDEAKLKKIFEDICQHLHAQNKVVCHRDLHSRNLMLKLDDVYFIDFQDARLGPVQYDLVSLLKDSYVDLSSKTQTHLLSWYYQNFVQPNDNVSADSFYRTYDIQTIQRCFKACGSFASFYVLRGDTRYLKYLTDTIQTVREALMKFPEYSFFLKIIEDHKVCDQNFETI